MRILTLCEHGNIRSVALAYLIKTIYKHEVLAAGIKDISEDTKGMLFNWADKIVFLDKSLVPSKIEYNLKPPKLAILDVGEDIWHDARNPDLMHKLLKRLKDLNL